MDKVYLSVDAIDSGLVRLETDNGETIYKKIRAFDFPVHEGDVISESNGKYQAEPEETKKRREENQMLLHRLVNSPPPTLALPAKSRGLRKKFGI